MFFQWLKNYLPRSLYGRAALILLVPIISIQLVVSVVFIQRHFNSITEQMTGVLADELIYLSRELEAAETLAKADAILARLAPAIGVQVVLPAQTGVTDEKRITDLTGARVTRVLYANVPHLAGVDLSVERQVVLGLVTRHGLLKININRARLSATNPHQLLVLMVLFSILMTVISFVFLRNQLRPIKRLASVAEAFGKGQNLNFRPAGSTEVRAAGRAFLDMRGRIERHIEQRTLMLSGVSHDLRTPLTRLKLGLSMLEQNDETIALAGDVADMERLVDEFLNFARADAQDSVAQRVDPAEFLRNLVENATRAGQVVTLGAMPDKAAIMLRQIPIRRALENLLGNAARYGSQTRASLRAGRHHVAFIIEDDGPGIAADSRAKALHPFTRLDKARNQDQGGGVGLGLAIAADIARTHGGQLRLGDSGDLGGLKAELIVPV